MSNNKQSKLHREHTVVSTSGPVGASFAVAEKNWKCSTCGAENFTRKKACFRCRAKKPAGGGGKVWHEGAVMAAAGIEHNWREAIDPNTKQLYYYNQKTGETRWDRPSEMGEAPHATGWYGRGRAGYQSKLAEETIEYLKRPAAKQAEEPSRKDIAYQEGANEYNFWYGKYSGGHDDNRNIEPAKSRCNVKLHAGYTAADKNRNDKNKKSIYFCLMWTRGECFRGSKCYNYHRIPDYADCGRLEKDMLHDCFGRDRHANHKDDMKGTGSFNNSCRTLYIGRLIRTPYAAKPSALHDVIMKHFEEWGEVEDVNVIWAKSIAFVRYRFRTHAELAKEAMSRQSLDHDEILDIRWAFDDPNPVAREALKRANADAVIAAIKASGNSVESSTPYALPDNYNVSSSSSSKSDEKKPSITDDPESYYPNTDHQYDKSGDEPKSKKLKLNN